VQRILAAAGTGAIHATGQCACDTTFPVVVAPLAADGGSTHGSMAWQHAAAVVVDATRLGPDVISGVAVAAAVGQPRRRREDSRRGWRRRHVCYRRPTLVTKLTIFEGGADVDVPVVPAEATAMRALALVT